MQTYTACYKHLNQRLSLSLSLSLFLFELASFQGFSLLKISSQTLRPACKCCLRKLPVILMARILPTSLDGRNTRRILIMKSRIRTESFRWDLQKIRWENSQEVYSLFWVFILLVKIESSNSHKVKKIIWKKDKNVPLFSNFPNRVYSCYIMTYFLNRKKKCYIVTS